MKDLPVLFKGEMVRAILADEKTETRREINWQKLHKEAGLHFPTKCRLAYFNLVKSWALDIGDDMMRCVRCPYGHDGDRLWVKETHRFPKSMDHEPAREIAALSLAAGYRKPWAPKRFEADGTTTDLDILHDFGTGEWGKLRPSIFMPRWASRIALNVTGVRVERLAAITEAGAKAEGVESVRAYAELWDKINGAGAWISNPHVWVVSFRRERH